MPRSPEVYLRDILIHQYFGVDIDIVWDIVQNKIPELEKQVRQILGRQSGAAEVNELP